MRRLSLLPAIATLAACSGVSMPGKPELPASLAPGWSLKSYDGAAAPAGLPAAASAPVCWKAEYTGTGTAQVWVCGYRASGSAFDAVQRARAEADTVKFQEDRYLVIAHWNGGTRAEIGALVRAVQRALGGK